MTDALAILKAAGAVLVPYPAMKGQRWPAGVDWRLRYWSQESARRFYAEVKKA